jgi:hypothetical protein
MLVAQPDGELVKVLDFGLSTVLPQSDLAVQRLTQTGMVLGTLLYMGPEVAMGQKADERSDVYSLGCVLYECLLGRPAFDGDDASQFMHKKQSGLPDRLAGRIDSSAISSKLEAVIFKALQREPEKRFQSAKEFGEALHLVLAGRQKELDLSQVQLDNTGRVANKSGARALLIGLLCALLLGAGGAALILKPWHEAERKAAAPKTTSSPAMQDWIADRRRAHEYLAQARASKNNGNYRDADARARAALLIIAHDYVGVGDGRQMVPDELDILNQIVNIYDRGSLKSKVQAAPIARIYGFYIPIFSRDGTFGNTGERQRIYEFGSILCKIYGDPTAAARFIALAAEQQPLLARRLLKEFQTITQTDVTSIASVRFYVSLAEARIFMAENQVQEARDSADRARQALVQMKIGVPRERFTCLFDLYKLEIVLHDAAAAKQAYEAAEKAAQDIADGLAIGMTGFGNDNSLAADSFQQLLNVSTDPQLKARATAQWKQFSIRAHAQTEMRSPLAR